MAKSSYFLLAILGALLTAGCSRSVDSARQLSKPVVIRVEATLTSATIEWNPVAGAEAYAYAFPADAPWKTTTGTRLILDGLAPGSIYSLRLKATGKAVDSEYETVDFATRFEFTFSVTALTPTGGVIAVAPAHPETPYFWDIVPTETVDGRTDAEILKAFQSVYGISLTGMTHLGAASRDVTGTLLPGRTYAAVAFGFDPHTATLTSRVYIHRIQVPSGEEFPLRFRFDVRKTGSTDFVCTIVPSDLTALYYPAIYATDLEHSGKEAVLEAMLGSLEEAIALRGYDYVASTMLRKGVGYLPIGRLAPGKEYKVYAIGVKRIVAAPNDLIAATTDLAWSSGFAVDP